MANVVVSPPFFPEAAGRAFDDPSIFRRIARLSQWDSRSRLLEFTSASAAICWAQDLGCEAVVVDEHPAVVGLLQKQVKACGLEGQLQVRQSPMGSLPFGDGDFDGIACFGRVLSPLKECLASYRRFLAPEGRLVLTHPVRVGGATNTRTAAFFQQRLGHELPTPAQVLSSLHKAGYEPEGMETLSEADLQALHKRWESVVSRGTEAENPAWAPVREELAAFRDQGSPCGVSFALFIGRRREPGERPPISRDRG